MWQRPDHVALDNQVLTRRREDERLDVGLDETDGETLRRSLGARPGQHCRRDVDTGHAMMQGGEEQREKAGAAADVETSSGMAPARSEMSRRHACACASVTSP